MEKGEKGFQELIRDFNKMYGLPLNEKPTLLGVERLENFKKVLLEEVNEVDEIINEYKLHGGKLDDEKKLQLLTSISDWMGDMIVYIASEAVKHGLDIDSSLKIIMESNFSKLGEDGKPIYDGRGKVLKGPSYFRPEPKLKDMIGKKISG